MTDATAPTTEEVAARLAVGSTSIPWPIRTLPMDRRFAGHLDTAGVLIDLLSDPDCIPHAARSFAEHGPHAAADYLSGVLVSLDDGAETLGSWLCREHLLELGRVAHRLFYVIGGVADDGVWEAASYNRSRG